MTSNLNNIFLSKNITIKKAMKKMDRTGKKTLFVTGRKRLLLGAVTDGDIRRWILAHGSLDDNVDNIYNRNPVYIHRNEIEGKPIDLVREKVVVAGVESLPVVDDNMRVVEVLFWKDLNKEEFMKTGSQDNLNLPVVIMAGGQGRRLDPFTKILPKALIPVGDKPVVEIIINEFMKYVSGDIYFVLRYKGEMIKFYFDNNNTDYQISYFFEGEKSLGTVGGLQLLPNDFPDTFFLSNCDTIIRAKYNDIYNFHKESKNDITVVGSMQHFVVPYGVMEISSGGRLKRIQEKPEQDLLVNTGMYVCEKKILQYLPKGKSFNTTDLIKEVIAHKGHVGVYPISEKSWFDTGQWGSYKESAKNLFNNL